MFRYSRQPQFDDIAAPTPRADDIVIDDSGSFDARSGSEAGKSHMIFLPNIASVAVDADSTAALVGSLQGETVLLDGEDLVALVLMSSGRHFISLKLARTGTATGLAHAVVQSVLAVVVLCFVRIAGWFRNSAIASGSY